MGRTPGYALSEEGRAQARALVDRLGALDAIYASPIQRARETAAPWAAAHERDVAIAPEFNEIDFGAWTGRTIASLEGEPDWVAYNTHRGRAQIPDGESFVDVAARIERGLDRVARAHPGGRVGIVSHADVIRVAVARSLGLDLDHLLRFEIGLASVSELEWGGGSPLVKYINRI